MNANISLKMSFDAEKATARLQEFIPEVIEEGFAAVLPLAIAEALDAGLKFEDASRATGVNVVINGDCNINGEILRESGESIDQMLSAYGGHSMTREESREKFAAKDVHATDTTSTAAKFEQSKRGCVAFNDLGKAEFALCDGNGSVFNEVDAIDAALFTGSGFVGDSSYAFGRRVGLMTYLERWERRLHELADTARGLEPIPPKPRAKVKDVRVMRHGGQGVFTYLSCRLVEDHPGGAYKAGDLITTSALISADFLNGTFETDYFIYEVVGE